MKYVNFGRYLNTAGDTVTGWFSDFERVHGKAIYLKYDPGSKANSIVNNGLWKEASDYRNDPSMRITNGDISKTGLGR